MPQFYEVAIKGLLHQQQIVSVFWYRSPAIGLPQEQDRQDAIAHVRTTVLPALRALQSTSAVWHDAICNSYTEAWAREPYLSRIESFTNAGTNAGASAAPLDAAIFSARVEPQVPGPQFKPGTTEVVMKPVRRGYWAFPGFLASAFTAEGTMVAETSWPAEALALRNALKAPVPANGARAPMEAIRVSSPLKGNPLRGYGLIREVTIRNIASTRRSRKRGVGA